MAITLYTIDRRNAYSGGAGSTLTLRPPDYSSYSPLSASNLPLDTTIFQTFFPQGISTQGQRYLINRGIDAGLAKHPNHPLPLKRVAYIEDIVELVFELIRRIEFPNCLSRFQAMFACDNLPALRAFVARTGTGGKVYDLDFNRCEQHDMAFLELGATNIEAWTNARNYWNGYPSSAPQSEYLVELPVNLRSYVTTI